MTSRQPIWQEASEDSDSSAARLATSDALEEMAHEAEVRDRATFATSDSEDSDEDEDDDADYEDIDDEDDDYEEAEDDDDDLDADETVQEIDLDENGLTIEADEEGNDEDDDEEGGEGVGLADIITAALNSSDDPATEGNDQQARLSRIIRSMGLTGIRQLLSQGGVTLGARPADGDDDDDEDQWYGTSRRSGMADFWDPIKEPIAAGQELLHGGDFGKTPKRPLGSPPSAFDEGSNLVDRIGKRRASLHRIAKTEMDDIVPNSAGTEVARYPARVYCGQYSEDSSFFYTCTQDFKVQMYDTTATSSRRVLEMRESSLSRRSRYYSSHGTTQYTSLKPIKTIQGRMGNWTITDANLSPCNQWMIYSSITPMVHLVSTKAEAQGGQDLSDRQVALDFGNGDDDGGVRYRSGIWSIRFSGDSREIVAGAHFGDIYVYDIEARRRVLRVAGHNDDVNGVAFADSASSNVLISGSDDSYVKVWDRRSLSGGKPAGVLPGHTEGITYVAPKGDGRYCISNGKDQSLKLWDLRCMRSSADFESSRRRDYGLRNWDYRNMYYRKPRFDSHPDDCSVMTYRGHAVLKTLIRCHFSPQATTGQKYIYSGSADGRIHIWSLDGQVVRVLDRSQAKSIFGRNTDGGGGGGGGQEAADPSAPDWSDEVVASSDDVAGGRATGDPATIGTRSGLRTRPTTAASSSSAAAAASSYATTVRDVSWHSSEASIMSTAWDGNDGQRGSIAKHEWKSYGKGTRLEDAIARTREEDQG